VSRFGKVLIAVLTLLVIFLVVWYFKNTKEVEKDKFVGFQGEAKLNPYLALERLGEHRNLNLEAKVNLGSWGAPSYGDTLFVPIEYIPDDVLLFSELEKWLENGGVLITGSARSQYFSEDVNISAMHRRLLGIKELSGSTESVVNIAVNGYDLKTPITYHYKVDGYKNEFTSNNGEFMYGEKNVGAGRIYLFNSLKAFDNKNLPNNDNAAFLLSLIDVDSRFIMATRPEYMGVWAWMKQRALWPLILIFACIISWLLMVSRRFGPIQKDRIQGSRKLMEHISVSGEYQWGASQGHQLLTDLKLGIEEMLQMRHPQVSKLNKEQQVLYMGSLSDLSIDEVNSAMTSPGKTPDQFYKSVIILKKIKEVL